MLSLSLIEKIRSDKITGDPKTHNLHNNVNNNSLNRSSLAA